MTKTTLKIDGMMCTMCEAHVKETIRRAVPGAKKVTASHAKGTAEFLSETPVDEDGLRRAISETGYDCTAVETSPYEKKGWFRR